MMELKMSRGMPSMTALLGLLAIAGYQNRDKLTELLRGSWQRCSSGTSQPLGGLLGNLGGMLGGAGAGKLLNGGVGELLDRFNLMAKVRQPNPGSILAQTMRSRLNN